MHRNMSNPLLPLEWELYIADGEPYVFDGYLYLYGSKDVKNGLEDGQQHFCSKNYHVVRTKDLVTWEDMGVSFSFSDLPKDSLPDTAFKLWAPDVCHNPKDGKYYLYICTNGKGGFFVASADRPEGPFTKAKPLTIDGKDCFPKVIDPGVLMDDDGKAYIVWPGGADHPWSVGQLNPEEFTDVLGDTITPIEGLVFPFEGPSLRKRGDTYYLIYIQNNGPKVEGNIQPSRMAYMTSQSPLGPYEYQGLIIDTSDYPGAINVHGSIVEWDHDWYVFYHIPVQGMELTRYACAAPIDFNPDGTMVQAKLTSCGPRASFKCNEEIPAISAVVYSEGKYEDRCSFENSYDAYLMFEKARSFAGFRYVDFEENTDVTFLVKAKSEVSCVLEVRADEWDGQLLAEVAIEQSNDYRSYSANINSEIAHRHAVYLIMKEKIGEGKLIVASFNFHRR